jgi:hypothetical protein
MTLVLPLLHLGAGCTNAATSSGSQALSADSDAVSDDGTTCVLPAGVEETTDAVASGCLAVPTGQACEVSNGASVNLSDGGVSNGTETCQSMCAASEYEVVCRMAENGPMPTPSATLECNGLALPEPFGVESYCCPCGE